MGKLIHLASVRSAEPLSSDGKERHSPEAAKYIYQVELTLVDDFAAPDNPAHRHDYAMALALARIAAPHVARLKSEANSKINRSL